MMININLYISLLFIIFTRIVSSIELSVDECLEKGFRKSDLDCNRCKELNKFNLNELKDSCLNCCQTDPNTNTIKKYSSARIDVCKCKIGYYPQISEFVKNKSKRFKNFSIKYLRGGEEPVLKLFDSKDILVEELNIQKWDTDTIDEFLTERIS